MEKSLTDDLSTLESTPTAEDSKALNDKAGPCLIMAGSGMCTGGRILHHLRHNLGKPESSVLIVGYQSEGSVGRRLVDGEREVSMFGERITVRALRPTSHAKPNRGPKLFQSRGNADAATPESPGYTTPRGASGATVDCCPARQPTMLFSLSTGGSQGSQRIPRLSVSPGVTFQSSWIQKW